MELGDGSRVGVIGGGPAGSLASHFLLTLAQRVDLELEVDIYEPRDFSRTGPAGCNNCGGIVSESLVQLLATEGINLPPEVVQRGIESYTLHTDGDRVHIRTPLDEMRIAALHRGSGPKGSRPGQWRSFDDFLLELACQGGAQHVPRAVSEVTWQGGWPHLRAKGGEPQRYDLLIGAFGVNSRGMELFADLGERLREPRKTRTCIMELFLGHDEVERRLGSSLHAFMLDIPRMEFAALIPKGEYVTVCILGESVDKEMIERFMSRPEVAECLPGSWTGSVAACRCMPRMNVGGSRHVFADRLVLVGDCGVSRLYKDGIGAAYRTAKACAITAVLHGVSQSDFSRYYWPTCRRLERDNRIGRLMFGGGALVKKLAWLRQAMLRLARREQASAEGRRAMSMILWDLFTGSAPYSDVFTRSLAPGFVLAYATELAKAVLGIREPGGSR